MNITINIDESLFDDVIKNELKAIPAEQLQKVIKDCIVERLKQPTVGADGKVLAYNVLESFFFEKNNYGYYNNGLKGTQLLEDVLRKIDYSDVATELKDTVINYIKNNNKKVTEDLLFKFMVEGMSKMIWSSEQFRSELQYAIHSQTTNSQ